MKKEQFFDMMNNVDDELITTARATKKTTAKSRWIKLGSMVACFCLLLSAAVAIPMMMNNDKLPDGSVISKYNGGEIIDSVTHTPLPGECFFFREVEEARKEYEGKDVKFLLAFDIFGDTEQKISDEELKSEYQRLADLGYKLYYVEDHWTFYGKGEKEYIPIVVGLFTEEQLANFDVNEKYGYAFHFETNGDGSSIEIDEENAVTNFNSILY